MAETYWELFAGYTVIWFLLLCFVVKLMCEQKKLYRELKALNEKLGAKGSEL